jgi:hypothetical protein
LLATGALAAAPGGENDGHHHHLDKIHDDCLKACGECAKECNMMAHHCLGKALEGGTAIPQHARAHSLAIDCQAFCSLAATMIARQSDLMRFSCESCAEACRCCAEACEKTTDAVMKACAAQCRECEKSCRAMVQSMKNAAKA